MSPLRDAWIIARYELAEALRAKRVWVLLLMYVGGAVAGSVLFIELLANVEATLAKTLVVSNPDKPGAMTRAMLQSKEFRDVLVRFVRDRELADKLISQPPLATFYGWLALTFLPVLVMLTSVESIASELGSGAARFSLLRTDRLTWAVGKLFGQTTLMVVSLLAGGLATLLVGVFRMNGIEPGETLWWLVLLCLRAGVYGFAFVGLALGLSQLTKSVQIARALGLVSLAVFGAVRALLTSDWAEEKWPVVSGTLAMIFPRSYQLDLWRPDFLERAPAMVMLACLGISYFALGHAYRKRKDA